MQVNYMGTVFATKSVINDLKKSGNGRLVIVSSQAGQTGVYGFSGYSATKFALKGLAESLQYEVGKIYP